MKHWKIIGAAPEYAEDIEFTCNECGHDALLPVRGVVIAQIGMGLVGDACPVEMPAQIQCPHCNHEYERDQSPTR